MSHYSIRQVSEYVIEYSEGKRTMDIAIDWRDPVPGFSFEQVSQWKPPHDQEPVDRATQLLIFERISAWLTQYGYDKIYISGHGYVRGTNRS